MPPPPFITGSTIVWAVQITSISFSSYSIPLLCVYGSVCLVSMTSLELG